MSDELPKAYTVSEETLAAGRGRGGPRSGAGRPKGSKNKVARIHQTAVVRQVWAKWIKDVQSVTRSEFRRERLRALAREEPWRYLERIAMPLALRAQPSVLPVSEDGDQLALPLVYMEIGDQARTREAEILGGVDTVEGEYVKQDGE